MDNRIPLSFPPSRHVVVPVFCAAFSLLVAACDTGVANPSPRVPATIMATTGSAIRSGTVDSQLAVSVRVADADGNPFENVRVEWLSEYSNGRVSDSSTMTNADGIAVVGWRLFHLAKPDTLIASVSGGGPRTTILANGRAGRPTSASETGPLGLTLNDVWGNPVPNATITWVAVNGGTVGAATTVTDADGHTQNTFGGGTAGQIYTVLAMATPSIIVTFNVQAP